MKHTLAALGAALVLGACATATPYQRAVNSNGGYSEQQIESDRWTVAFSGNSLTDRQTVETYLLYRAAELTVEQGFDHFQVVERDTDADTAFISTGFSSTGFARFHYSGFGPGFHQAGFRSRRFAGPFFYDDIFFAGPTDFREVTSYLATAEIILGAGEKPKGDPAFFDADEVLVNLSGALVRPGA